MSYLNTLPFRWAIRNSSLPEMAEMSEDIPAVCAQKLLDGTVDLALVPVAVIPQLKEHYIVSDYCIGADGVVDSVKLYSEVPVKDVQCVRLDYQSRTSVNLVRVLFRFFWKSRPEYVDAEPGFEREVKNGTAAVVIGDRTFSLSGKYRFETDLAQAWKDFTGLPFVFAAWVSNKKLPGDFLETFNSVLHRGATHVDEAVAAEPEHPVLNKTEVADYLRNRIDYRLDAKKREAMALFHSYLRKL